MDRNKQIEDLTSFLWTHTSIVSEYLCGSVAADLVNAGYRKSTDLAREIFEEIDAHFARRIAFYQDMRFRAYTVGKDEEVKYANTMITNLTIYKEEIAELKKKYTEGEG